MQKVVWLGVLPLFALVALLLCGTSAQSAPELQKNLEPDFQNTTTVSWSGGSAAQCEGLEAQGIDAGANCAQCPNAPAGTTCCNLCGGDYACADNVSGAWDNGTKTFQDPTPPGSLVTTVTMTVFEVGCSPTGSSDSVNVTLNGTQIGSWTDGTACACSSCDPSGTNGRQLTLTNANGIPNYAYGKTNTVVVNPGNADPCVSKITISLNGADPACSLSSATLTFGNQEVGTTSAAQNVVVTNTGGADLVINSAAATGPFGVSGPTLPATVHRAGTATFGVTFQPTATGAASGTLTISSNDPSGAKKVTLSGTATAPVMKASPSSIAFGSTNVGVATASQSITVQNTGTAPLNVKSVTFSGANQGDFPVQTSLPFSVAAGGTSTIALQFDPTAVGARSATATVTSDDPVTPTFQSSLTGTGTAPSIAASPTSVDFGNVSTGTTSAAQTVTVTNTGTGPLSITSATITGTNATAFALGALSTPIVLQAGGQQALSVTFSPTTVAADSAALTIASDDPNSPSLAVPLGGSGITLSYGLTPTTLDFGGQLVGRGSLPRTLTINNTGSSALTVQSLAFGGAQGAAFSQPTPATLPATINAGSSLTVDVVYTPTAVGAAAATLTMTSSTAGVPQGVVNLSGVGASTLLSIDKTSLDFGTIRAGTKSQPLTATITNTGGDPITMNDGNLTGPNAIDFVATPVAGQIASGKSVTTTVLYEPASAVTSAATLTFAASDSKIPTAVVSLKGVSLSSFLSLDQNQLNFGHVPVGQESPPQTVQVKNISTAPLTIGSAAADDPQFLVNAALGTLAAGQTTSVTVTFQPSQAGDAAANIKITLQGASSPEIAIFASGTGDATGGGGSSGCGCGAVGSNDAGTLAFAGLAGVAAIGLAIRRRKR